MSFTPMTTAFTPVMESSPHRFLYECADPCLVGGGQVLQGEGGRPHVPFVAVLRVLETERRIPRLELLPALEEADDLVVLGVRGHPVPGLWRERWRARGDDRMEALGGRAIRLGHLGDLREDSLHVVRAPLGQPSLLDGLLQRGAFPGRESRRCLAGRALDGLLRALLCSVLLSHI